MKLPTPNYEFGTSVYLKNGSDLVGIVTGYVVRPPNNLLYLVRWSDGSEDEHWHMEISNERDYKTVGES